MSWLFGAISKHGSINQNFNFEESYKKVEKHNLFLAVSDNSQTSFLQDCEVEVSACVGVPITSEENQKKILSNKSFGGLKKENINELFGHFVVLFYSKNNLEIFNDALGIRDLYYFNSEERLIFSTRIDLVVKYKPETLLNDNEFSSLWLTNFQLSHNSILSGIDRLGPGGKISFKGNKFQISKHNFAKYESDISLYGFSDLIKNYSNVRSADGKQISLGLSGGIDARLILSNLLDIGNGFKCHSLVNEENNDLKIASKITENFNLEHKLIFRKSLDLFKYEKLILNYYKNIPPVIELTQLMDFGIFGKDYLKNYILVDGGFGEFYRMQYLKRIFIKGYKKFNIKNSFEITNSLLAIKPQIFNQEFHEKLNVLLSTKITNLITELGEPRSKLELADIIDFITSNFKLPNIYGPGQTILDQNFISFMPFAQRDIINAGMNISINKKNESKLFKSIIKLKQDELSKINLVKNNLENPFWLNDNFVMLRLLLNRKFTKQNNHEKYNILFDSKEFVYYLLEISKINESQYLDVERNWETVNQFYSGDLSKGDYVDWLLTFIIWKKANKIAI